MYQALLTAYGPQSWWPASSATEVVIGAILTQNTSWKNVERAIAAMRTTGCIDFGVIHGMGSHKLAGVIRPAGTYNVKARRLKAFAAWLIETHEGDLKRALSGPTDKVRSALLAIDGIGPETADAILLYAGDHATFVVDAYTRRILKRHGLIDEHESYDRIKMLMERSLAPDVQVFNEYHALLVEVGKRHCRSRADCTGCPLDHFPHEHDPSAP